MFVLAFFASLFLVHMRMRDKKPFVLVTSSTGGIDSLAGIFARTFLGARWILEVRDVWPDAPLQAGPATSSFGLFFLIEHLHRLSFWLADGLMSPLQQIQDRFSTGRAKQGRPFLWIPNCSRRSEHLDSSALRRRGVDISVQCDELKQFVTGFERTIGYFGSMNNANKVDRLVKLALSLAEEDVGFVFVGGGEGFNNVVELARGNTKILVQPDVPAICLPTYMAEVDILMFGFPYISAFKYGLSPLKYSDYLQAGKPVFYWGPPQLEEENQELGHMVSVHSSDVQEARRGIAFICSLPDERLAEMGRKARMRAQNFCYDNYEEQFVSLISSLRTPRGQPEGAFGAP